MGDLRGRRSLRLTVRWGPCQSWGQGGRSGQEPSVTLDLPVLLDLTQETKVPGQNRTEEVAGWQVTRGLECSWMTFLKASRRGARSQTHRPVHFLLTSWAPLSAAET